MMPSARQRKSLGASFSCAIFDSIFFFENEKVKKKYFEGKGGGNGDKRKFRFGFLLHYFLYFFLLFFLFELAKILNQLATQSGIVLVLDDKSMNLLERSVRTVHVSMLSKDTAKQDIQDAFKRVKEKFIIKFNLCVCVFFLFSLFFSIFAPIIWVDQF